MISFELKLLSPIVLLAQRGKEKLIFHKSKEGFNLLYSPFINKNIDSINDLSSLSFEYPILQKYDFNNEKDEISLRSPQYHIEVINCPLSIKFITKIHKFLSKYINSSVILHMNFKDIINKPQNLIFYLKNITQSIPTSFFDRLKYIIHFLPISSLTSSVLDFYDELLSFRFIRFVINLTEINGISLDELEKGLIHIEDSGYSFPAFFGEITQSNGNLMSKILDYCVGNRIVNSVFPMIKMNTNPLDFSGKIDHMYEIWKDYFILWCNDKQKPYMILEPIRIIVLSLLSIPNPCYRLLTKSFNEETLDNFIIMIKSENEKYAQNKLINNMFQQFIPWQYIQDNNYSVMHISYNIEGRFRNLFIEILQFVLDNLSLYCKNSEDRKSRMIIDLKGKTPSFKTVTFE